MVPNSVVLNVSIQMISTTHPAGERRGRSAPRR